MGTWSNSSRLPPLWPGEPADWPEYIAARVASMTTTYGISAIVTVGRDGLDDMARGICDPSGEPRPRRQRSFTCLFTVCASRAR